MSDTAARGLVTLVDDTTGTQSVQVAVLDEEPLDAERAQQYGFSSVPLPPSAAGQGCEAVVIFMGGSRSHPVVVGTDDRRHRPPGLVAGEVIIYDDQGLYIRLHRAVPGPGGQPARIVIEGGAIELGAGALESAVLGDAFATLYNAHTHPTGAGPSGPPVVPMASPAHLSTIVKVA